jgi:hypothetical protein
MSFLSWLFGVKPKPIHRDPTLDWPTPSRGDYMALPAALDDFDWTDTDYNVVTVDADGTVKEHAWLAHMVGTEWTSLDYREVTQIAAPGPAWVSMNWMRPSWYDQMIVQPAAVQAAQEAWSW